ncbi:hypothetical protein DMN91_004806 [Ooceraea biroi]|uniref:Uncharacterized protein n=1 Tax=Ooceraea biroi TaxID=2015173 RepID=A0A3L8DRV0_OOCBI|nr:uncharacterized protein LOC113561975 [Ooceraea biroi]RLU22528.1 hypothetical protein DMN91_004806 [Ooceraea biroi]
MLGSRVAESSTRGEGKSRGETIDEQHAVTDCALDLQLDLNMINKLLTINISLDTSKALRGARGTSVRHCGDAREKRESTVALSFFHRDAYRAPAATCQSDRSRACSPANARLECDPAWGHGHVLGEGQRTPPCSTTPPRLTWACIRVCMSQQLARSASRCREIFDARTAIDIDTGNIDFCFSHF